MAAANVCLSAVRRPARLGGTMENRIGKILTAVAILGAGVTTVCNMDSENPLKLWFAALAILAVLSVVFQVLTGRL
jgi:hypothetical protein